MVSPQELLPLESARLFRATTLLISDTEHDDDEMARRATRALGASLAKATCDEVVCAGARVNHALRYALVALCASAVVACGNVCEDAASVAIDKCGIDESEAGAECPESNECAAECVVDHEDIYCDALRGDSGAVATMDGCTSQCGE